MSPEPEPLAGGNVSGSVVRVGDTVRRPAGPWTPAVHALLRHLHEIGFDGAPLPVGLDAEGREVLTFLPGTVPWPDRFELLEPSERLVGVARLIRHFHDAVASFSPPAGASWQVLIPAEGDEIIAHNDLAPWNLVIGQSRCAFIDWDAAAPGSRLWDLAYAAHGFVPLSAGARWQGLDLPRRLEAFAAAYGLDEAQRRQLLPMLGRRTRSMHDFLAAGAADGLEPWARLWRQGHGDTWRRDSEFIEQCAALWEKALLG
jgi:Ser/Thr protein kinase RdoA (MazF antagonist)